MNGGGWVEDNDHCFISQCSDYDPQWSFFLHFLAIFWKVHFYYMAEVKQRSSEKQGDSVDEKFYFSYER